MHPRQLESLLLRISGTDAGTAQLQGPVDLPITTPLPIQQPHPATGARRHIPRMQRALPRPAPQARRTAAKQIKHQQPRRLLRAHQQIMVFRHCQPGQRQRLRGLRCRRRKLTSLGRRRSVGHRPELTADPIATRLHPHAQTIVAHPIDIAVAIRPHPAPLHKLRRLVALAGRKSKNLGTQLQRITAPLHPRQRWRAGLPQIGQSHPITSPALPVLLRQHQMKVAAVGIHAVGAPDNPAANAILPLMFSCQPPRHRPWRRHRNCV